MIKAICVLNNFIRLLSVFTIPSGIFNNDDKDGYLYEILDEIQQNNHQLNRTRPKNSAIGLRYRLCTSLWNIN